MPSRAGGKRPLITEKDIHEVEIEAGGQFSLPPGALVTPLARQVAMERGIQLVESSTPVSTSPQINMRSDQSGTTHKSSSASGIKSVQQKTVALGADHGGFHLKETLKAFLSEAGYAVMDCGTSSTDSVDYPDFALAVAQLVSQGRAWRGIIVDGAGIGSCMVANKVTGVRAAMCYDQSTAINSREHNDANVLTLGAGLIGENLSKQIAKTWLETDSATGRHARRVQKIMEVEARYHKRK